MSKKRDQILEAATNVFRNVGFDGASMDRISDAAKASKRTVYNYFPSKEELFQAVVSGLMSKMGQLKEVAWQPDHSVEDQLKDFARAKTLDSKHDPALCLHRVVLGVLIKHPQMLQEVMKESERYESALVTWLSKANEAGKLKIADADESAKLFWSMASGALFWPQLMQGPFEKEEQERVIDEVVKTFLARFSVAPL